MMLLLHTPCNTSNSHITQNHLWSLNLNKKLKINHHHQYSSSSSIWNFINVNTCHYSDVKWLMPRHGLGKFINVNGNGLGMLAAAVVLSTPPPSDDYFTNIPSEIAGKSCDPMDKECDQANTQMKKRIQRPKSRNAETCTTKCVGTCIRGGEGSPGEGPLNVRRPIIVFKQGFRSRQYCLVECSDICNLLDDIDKGH